MALKNGDNLKRLRKRQALTLVGVAEHISKDLGINVAYQNIQELENNKRKIPYKWLIPLSEIYCCSIDELVNGGLNDEN